MRTLFFVSSALFLLSALSWFFVWAIWIHAQEGWFGRASGPVAEASRATSVHSPAARHLAWYARLKAATVVLLIATIVLLAGWQFSR